MPESITEAVILAGGFGTRLRSAVPDLPKCMAPVNGVPFIAYVVNHFRAHGIQNFIFALGYKSKAFESFLHNILPAGSYKLSIENEPLGTGGAIQFACSKARNSNVVIANGDTLFRIRVQELAAFHVQKNAHCTMALKPMKAVSRYGAVMLNEDQSVKSFAEKRYFDEGLINGGVYVLNIPAFFFFFCLQNFHLKKSTSKDFMQREKYMARP